MAEYGIVFDAVSIGNSGTGLWVESGVQFLVQFEWANTDSVSGFGNEAVCDNDGVHLWFGGLEVCISSLQKGGFIF